MVQHKDRLHSTLALVVVDKTVVEEEEDTPPALVDNMNQMLEVVEDILLKNHQFSNPF